MTGTPPAPSSSFVRMIAGLACAFLIGGALGATGTWFFMPPSPAVTAVSASEDLRAADPPWAEAEAALNVGDHGRAHALASRLAEEGHAEAMLLLARMYETGAGVERSERTAFGLLQQAAEQGLPDAQRRLATFYAYGRGVEQDYVRASEWSLRAREAEAGTGP